MQKDFGYVIKVNYNPCFTKNHWLVHTEPHLTCILLYLHVLHLNTKDTLLDMATSTPYWQCFVQQNNWVLLWIRLWLGPSTLADIEKKRHITITKLFIISPMVIQVFSQIVHLFTPFTCIKLSPKRSLMFLYFKLSFVILR